MQSYKVHKKIGITTERFSSFAHKTSLCLPTFMARLGADEGLILLEQEMREIFSLGKSEIHIEKEDPIEKLYIELTNRCNLACKMCFRMNFTDTPGTMTEATLHNLVHTMNELKGLKSVVIGGVGEPLLHDELKYLVRFLKEKHIHLSIQTNGTLLEGFTDFLLSSGLDRIVVSYEPGSLGHTESSYVFSAVQRLIALKTRNQLIKPIVSLESVITENCIESLPHVVEQFLGIGISELILTNLLPVREQYNSQTLFLKKEREHLLERTINMARGRVHLLVPYLNLKTERHCNFVENNASVVRFDGEVAPCFRFLHSGVEYVLGRRQDIPSFSFGNVNEKALSSIWRSREYIWFRYCVSHSQYPSCIDCSFSQGCAYITSAATDCWGNIPSCGNCLWSRNILLCP